MKLNFWLARRNLARNNIESSNVLKDIDCDKLKPKKKETNNQHGKKGDKGNKNNRYRNPPRQTHNLTRMKAI